MIEKQPIRKPEDQARYDERKLTQVDRIGKALIKKAGILATDAEASVGWVGQIDHNGSGTTVIKKNNGSEIRFNENSVATNEYHPVYRDGSHQYDRVKNYVRTRLSDEPAEAKKLITQSKTGNYNVWESERNASIASTDAYPLNTDGLGSYTESFSSDLVAAGNKPIWYSLDEQQSLAVKAGVLNKIRGDISDVKSDIKRAESAHAQQKIDEIMKA